MTETATRRLAEQVAEVTWYQSLRLPGDIATSGQYDTIDELKRVPLPDSLEGLRCLDVGTADGFWAFEMERRGASEVVAVDLPDVSQLDWPGNAGAERKLAESRKSTRRRGFDIAHEALGSRVQWRGLLVYELTPEIVGEFDFAFMGSLLLHLRDPVAALTAVGSVLRGELLSVDALSPPLTILHPKQPVARLEAHGWPTWWALNLQAYRRLFDAAGLETLTTGRPFFVKKNPTYMAGPQTRRSSYQQWRQATIARLGILHSWTRARTQRSV